jgi:polar amino acid transport system substrate-binding protein
MLAARFLRSVAVAALLVLGLAACGGGEGSGEYALINEGQLTVCSEIPYPPFEMEGEDGEFTGFDIDLITAIADELDLEVNVLNTGFDGIQSGSAMAAGTCDIAASAMTITEAREENLDFSEPYFRSDQSLLVKADSGITTLADLAGKRIGVQSETTGAAYAEENAPDDATITDFPSGSDAILALQGNQVDAVLQDLGPNADAVNNDDTLAVIETYPTEENYGFAVAEEGREALLEAVNEALQTLRDNGTYDEIYDRYFPDTSS